MKLPIPKAFSTLKEKYPMIRDVEENIRQFCETYKIDSFRCAKELISFAAAFKHFNFDLIGVSTDNTHNDEDLYNLQEPLLEDMLENIQGTSDDDNDDGCLEDSLGEVKTFINCLSILTGEKVSSY